MNDRENGQIFKPGDAVQHKVFGGKYAVLWQEKDGDVVCRNIKLEQVTFVAAELEPFVVKPGVTLGELSRRLHSN